MIRGPGCVLLWSVMKYFVTVWFVSFLCETSSLLYHQLQETYFQIPFQNLPHLFVCIFLVVAKQPEIGFT